MATGESDPGRAGFERGDWPAAVSGWAGRLIELDGPDLADLATAAELTGDLDLAVSARQRAFRLALDAGEDRAAARCAVALALLTGEHGQPAIAAGWQARAEDLLDRVDTDGPEQGWLAFVRMFRSLAAGDLPAASAQADAADASGRRHGEPDLVVAATCARGRLALYAGRVPDGLSLLDEAMVRVLAGETDSPVVAGSVYCSAIEACQEISDLGRVAEWTGALERWCAAQPGLLTFTGQCAVHRGQLLRVDGDWSAALAELDRASERYRAARVTAAEGLAAYERGEVLRLRGDLDPAEEAYRRAADHGFDPQPGLALLWLARGRRTAAAAALDRLLAETAGPVPRLRLLPAAVEVLVAADERDRAAAVAQELADLAAGHASPSLDAAAAQALGRVRLAAGDPSDALGHLRQAAASWDAVGAPYERARVRVLTARALASLGDDASARRELEAARTTFARLGAAPESDEVTALLAPPDLPAGLTPREAEVLRLVAAGRSNAAIASTLVLSEKTVARHLSNIFTKLGVGSRTAAAAYAYEHGLQ